VLIVALTGGIGSGKSLAGQYFESLGAIVVDSDQLARDVIERGTEGFDEVLTHFGDGILTNGEIDRKKLGEIVFANEQERLELEGIIHPRIQAQFAQIIEDAPENAIIINQIPLLVETSAADRFDRVITVVSPIEMRITRLESRGLSRSEIEKRMSVQASDEQRIEVSDFIIENIGSPDDLLREVESTFEELQTENIG
jgi:dephospho-CoA kinase